MKLCSVFLSRCIVLFFLFSTGFASASSGLSAPQPNQGISAQVTSSGNQYWTTVVVKLTNTTDKSIDMSDAIIEFTSPKNVSSVNISSTALTWANSPVTNTNEGDQFNVKVSLVFEKGSWVKTELPPQGTLTLTFGVDATVNNEALEKSVQVFAGDFKCEGSINLIAPKKPGSSADSKASAFLQNANKSYQKTFSLYWNSSLPIPELCYGNYTVHTNPSGDYVGGIDQNVTLSDSHKSQSITLSYHEAPKVTDVTLSVTGGEAGIPAPKIYIQQVNATSPSTYSINWGETKVIKVTAGSTYKLWSTELTDNNLIYTPNYTESQPYNFTPKEDTAMTATVSFVAKPIPTVNATINIGGKALPENFQTTIKLVGNKGQKYSFDNLGAGEQSIEVQDGVYNLTASSYKDGSTQYVSALQNPYTISSGSTIDLNFSEMAQKLAVGYLENNTSPYIKISEANQKGYNVIVVAFAVVSGSTIKLYDNVFLPYQPYWQDLTPEQIQNMTADIDLAKKQPKNPLRYVLASVGGEANTFAPGGADYTVVAKNMVDFLHTYHFDGFDFDLEVVPAEVTDDYLSKLITEIRRLDPGVIITSAPQVNNVNGSLNYVNTGVQQVYTKAIDKGLFDYIFVQEYNTGGNYVDAQGVLCNGKQEGCVDETSPEFIVNSFYALKKVTPSSTLIVPGEPATANAAGAATVYHPADGKVDNVYTLMGENYKLLLSDPQFGGAMTWSIRMDITGGYPFINMINSWNNPDNTP